MFSGNYNNYDLIPYLLIMLAMFTIYVIIK